MFRLTRILRQILADPPFGGAEVPLESIVPAIPTAPVVVWNLIRRCNLECLHCYSSSSGRHFDGELTTVEVFGVLEDLRGLGVPALILSGGEPLLRPDLFEIAKRAKGMGFHLALSSNGVLIDAVAAGRIRDAGFDYVGVSLDGAPARHDRMRGKAGAFGEALTGLSHLRQLGLNTGIRFTQTSENVGDLPFLLELMRNEGIERFYLSHLNYSGRGAALRSEAPSMEAVRHNLTQLFDLALLDAQSGSRREMVTGNNCADGPWLLRWVEQRLPERRHRAEALLRAWGGDASGVGIANIDNRGNVHPDIFWWNHTLGNVRQRPFSAIWRDNDDELLVGLRQRPRPVKGRCGGCQYLPICGGNTRVRAHQLTGDPWAEDPGCYLTDEEIGWSGGG
ncbi:MAG: heme d1 biosynthesis radical SAM protein NirJ [Magnetococcales bacterium]|nr:heme d1 biosynthesis radical SAM protein NirJ [Magnetococcales bacterium]